MLNCKALSELHGPIKVALIFPVVISQTPAYVARPQYEVSALCDVPVYTPAFAGTHLYAQRDGQAELT